MYPNLFYVFKDLFGIEIEGLRFVNSFGFFVAIAFIIAAVILSKELQRKSGQGFFQPSEMQIMVGEPANWIDLLSNFLLGFLLGYKILALFLLSKSATTDPQAFIFSLNGSWPAGIGLGLLFAGLKWWEKKKNFLPKPEKRTIRIWPHDRVGEITILALIFGLLGAKLFDIFENWSGFVKNPSSYIFSPAGLCPAIKRNKTMSRENFILPNNVVIKETKFSPKEELKYGHQYTILQIETEIMIGPVNNIIVFLQAMNEDDLVRSQHGSIKILFFRIYKSDILFTQPLHHCNRDFICTAAFVCVDVQEAMRSITLYRRPLIYHWALKLYSNSPPIRRFEEYAP